MTLGSTQREFTRNIGYLIEHIYASGYECTFGDAYRDPRSHMGMGFKGPYGRANSAHKQRLAVDLNLFFKGRYLRHTKAHAPFGDYWKALHPDHVWGGDFKSNDSNHYSRRYGGIS